MRRSSLKVKIENFDKIIESIPQINAAVINKPKLVLVSAKKKDPLTARQQSALVIKYRFKARKMALSVLRNWHSRLDSEEIDSVVDLSLCEAVKRFDPKKGASFMTFLYYHLKGNLVRTVTIAANSRSVPVLNFEKQLKGQVADHQFRGLTSDDVADALIGDEQLMPDEHFWKKQLGEKSQAAFSKLDALEKQIIERVFIAEEQIMDIARDLGYSRCHISRVKKRAISTLFQEFRESMNLTDIVTEAEIYQAEINTKLEPDSLLENRSVLRRKPRSRASLGSLRSSKAKPFDWAESKQRLAALG